MSTAVPNPVAPYPPVPGQPSGAGTFEPPHPYRTAEASGPFGNHATLADGLVSYWPLDEESGTRYDSVGSNDLTDNNTVGFSAVAGPPNFPGGKAASFVAANSEYLSVAHNNSLLVSSTGFTFNVWFKSTSGELYMSKDDGGANRTFAMVGSNYVFETDSTYSQATGTTPDTNWHMHTFGFDIATGMAFNYRDNANFQQGAVIAGVQDQVLQPLEIGRFSTSFANGLIGPVGFWTRTLTAQERTDLYAAGAGLFYGD